MKCSRQACCIRTLWSPSMRREWIEILTQTVTGQVKRGSPSMRREWIEIKSHSPIRSCSESPSMRREWIEIFMYTNKIGCTVCLPPCGGSGLKCFLCSSPAQEFRSPSMRREWIEMRYVDYISLGKQSPSMRREWIEITI